MRRTGLKRTMLYDLIKVGNSPIRFRSEPAPSAGMKMRSWIGSIGDTQPKPKEGIAATAGSENNRFNHTENPGRLRMHLRERSEQGPNLKLKRPPLPRIRTNRLTKYVLDVNISPVDSAIRLT